MDTKYALNKWEVILDTSMESDVFFPIVKRIYAKTIASNLIEVRPMGSGETNEERRLRLLKERKEKIEKIRSNMNGRKNRVS